MIETFIEEYRDGSTVEFVRIERAKDEYSIMTKAYYDELEAAKEIGTISQEYGKTLQGRSAAQGADR